MQQKHGFEEDGFWWKGILTEKIGPFEKGERIDYWGDHVGFFELYEGGLLYVKTISGEYWFKLKI